MNKSKWASPEPVLQHEPPADLAPASLTVSPPASKPVTAHLLRETPSDSALLAEEEFQTVSAYDPYIDEFAQTREDDLLFDDDIVPIAESQTVQELEETAQPLPELATVAVPTAPAAPTRGQGIGGRGRGGKRGGAQAPEGVNGSATDEASKQMSRKEVAVRGDRSGTGGLKRTKLTEEELAKRMAAIQLKNASLTAAHAKAEADAASFEAREAAAAARSEEVRKRLAERQKQERVNRSQMMVDREKNRQRKLDALKGREWDNEKEDGFAGTGEEKRGGARRGAHGGVVGGIGRGDIAAEHIELQGHQDSSPRGRSRGRSGRGRGARGGRGGRGDSHTAQTSAAEDDLQAIPTASDFPDLPPAAAHTQSNSNITPVPLSFPSKSPKTKDQGSKDLISLSEVDKNGDDEAPKSPKKQDSYEMPLSPADQKRSWADQVEGTMSPT